MVTARQWSRFTGRSPDNGSAQAASVPRPFGAERTLTYHECLTWGRNQTVR